MKKTVMVILLSVGALIGHAGIYESDSNQGTVTYTDTPTPDSKPVDVSGTGSTISAPPVTQSAGNSGITVNEKASAGMYSTFMIVSPQDQQNTQGQSPIPVKIRLEPALKTGNKIQLFIDGQAFGAPFAGLDSALSGVKRGEHQLSAAIVDANNAIVQQSNSLTLHVHHTSTVTSPAMKRPAPGL